MYGMLEKKVQDRLSIAELRSHRAFEFCRNQFASKLDRKLNQSYFTAGMSNQLSSMAANNVQRISPEEQKKMEMMNECNFIIEDLLKFRNASKFYYSNALWLMQNCPDLDFTIFLMAKRAVQKFSIIYYYLKNEIFPNHKELSLQNCSLEGWNFFLKREERAGITCTIINDLVDARSIFEEALAKATNTFNGSSKAVQEVINDDMNVTHTNMIEEFMKNAVKVLVNSTVMNPKDPMNGQKLNVCLY